MDKQTSVSVIASKPKHWSLMTATEPRDQHPRAGKRVLPKSVVKMMMIKETASCSTSPRIECSRCHTHLIQKFMVLIQGGWNHDDPWVCRLCYDKKNDLRVEGPKNRVGSKRSC